MAPVAQIRQLSILIGALYIIALGFVASFWARGAYRYLPIEEVRQTIRGHTSPLFGLWVSSVGIGSILAGVGMLLYVRSKEWRIWLFGIGVFVVLLIDMLSRWRILPEPGHIPALFGIGGGLITVLFLAILWLWAKKHGASMALQLFPFSFEFLAATATRKSPWLL